MAAKTQSHMTMEMTMEKNETRDQELVELGAASIETRGPLNGNSDTNGGGFEMGLSDRED